MGLTPMMQQYLAVHERVPDAILFFRLGDFYEMFFDDAVKASKELEIALTGKDCGLEERAPMCGVPYHSAENYIAKLVERGYKVAVCEQMEDPKSAKGIVKRDIVRIVSPGTISSDDYIKASENNYLVSLCLDRQVIGIAYTDVTTGAFYAAEIPAEKDDRHLQNELGRIAPSEIILNPALYKKDGLLKALETRFGCMTDLYGQRHFELRESKKRIKDHFHVYALDALGMEGHDAAIRAAGALIAYIDETQKTESAHINHLSYYHTDAFMLLDLSARKHLELTETMRGGEKRGSLLWVLDRTVTAMGARMLRQWVISPLIRADEILKRQNDVEELADNAGSFKELKALLGKVYDMERICAKAAYGTLNPKDVLALKQSLSVIPPLTELIRAMNAPVLSEKFLGLDTMTDIFELIDSAISDDAPFALKDGNVIKAGYHPEVDKARQAGLKGKDWLRDMEASEREKTGIKNLKIKYNKVFGYFIEVTKSNLDAVPETYIRKQTLANAERFFTPELKTMETEILGAEEKLSRLEYQLFRDIREKIVGEIGRLQALAGIIATLDAEFALACAAVDNHYVKPEIAEDGVIDIRGGRHPAAEALMEKNAFIANDCLLDKDAQRMMLITGPNMAGKSTYIRQVAIITLMAQIGSFVPADSAHIGIVDRIFTRVGASDDLTTGQSTFMVEMSEVSNILKNATSDSLVILDEIGRGTSTFDGVSIAWAVAEYLLNPNICGAKTLFATHYHELTELENLEKGIHNYSIGLKETKNGVIFLRKLKPGAADKSYGIEVATLAGFPGSVTKRAKSVLKELEKGEKTYREGLFDHDADRVAENQISFITMAQNNLTDTERKVLEDLKDIEINTMTPMEAINTLNALKTALNTGGTS